MALRFKNEKDSKTVAKEKDGDCVKGSGMTILGFGAVRPVLFESDSYNKNYVHLKNGEWVSIDSSTNAFWKYGMPKC